MPEPARRKEIRQAGSFCQDDAARAPYREKVHGALQKKCMGALQRKKVVWQGKKAYTESTYKQVDGCMIE